VPAPLAYGPSPTPAAERMGVSRQTCTRIFNRARTAVARSLVEQKMLLVGDAASEAILDHAPEEMKKNGAAALSLSTSRVSRPAVHEKAGAGASAPLLPRPGVLRSRRR